jgi:hypothetical protein
MEDLNWASLRPNRLLKMSMSVTGVGTRNREMTVPQPLYPLMISVR